MTYNSDIRYDHPMPNPPRSSDDIRAAYINFFKEKGHVLLPSWPLVPIGDPTSLFTSAGMQQFKPWFLGEQPASTPRAVTVQRCFRTTDIEEVGDLSHCTAFEMLGNFSFGNYFKREAIAFAWELMTQVYGMDPNRLHVTIFLTDDDARTYWLEMGMPDDHIHRRDEELNYWFSFSAGGSGPCGPDSEIYYDFYPEEGIEGAQAKFDADGNPLPGIGVGYDDRRFLEIWNLVFMQLYQSPDGSRADLPAQNIDTGSGLERVACVLQGVRSVFETDIFLPILHTAALIAGREYSGDNTGREHPDYALRAMSEHCRAATLLIGDGVVPSNEGRGYVLRRVIRRAIYFARKIGVRDPFTARLADAAIDKLMIGYPHLHENRDFIKRALNAEEERFIRTLAGGSQRLETLLGRLRESGTTIVPGDEAFLLYDTFGLPLELTREIAAGEGFTVDDAGFRVSMDAQRQRARDAGKFFKGEPSPLLKSVGEDHSDFVGYVHTEADATVIAIVKGAALADLAVVGDECEVLLDTTPFYPEGGGQMGDRGIITTPTGRFQVEDTQASSGAIVHRGRVIEGELRVATGATAAVDLNWRRGSARNHTGTHLLHAALRTILGQHVRQQGSLVSPDRLRFDFTHLEQTPRSVLREVEQLANARIRDNLDVQWRRTGYREAVEGGALAFFGDKYGNEVRVVEIRDASGVFSAELCGGTHTNHTGDLGFVHILRESAVAAGTRRIEALTGAGAESYLLEQQDRLQRMAESLSIGFGEIEERVAQMQSEVDRLRRENAELLRARSGNMADALAEAALDLSGVKLVVARVHVANVDGLKEVADRLRAKLQSALVVLGADIEGKPAFLVAATPDVVAKGVHSGNLVRDIAKTAGGGGGGRPDLAQAGARDASKLDAALAEGERLARVALD